MEVYRYWGIDDFATMNELYNYQAGRLIECVSETCCNSTLTKEKRKAELQTILNDADTRMVVTKIKPNSLSLAICILPIKWKSMWMCSAMGHAIGFAKKRFSHLFYRLRSKVAQKAK